MDKLVGVIIFLLGVSACFSGAFLVGIVLMVLGNSMSKDKPQT